MSKKTDKQLVAMARTTMTLSRENAQLSAKLAQQQQAAPPPAPPAAPPPAPPPAPKPIATREEIESSTPASTDPFANKRNALGRALALRDRGLAIHGKR